MSNHNRWRFPLAVLAVAVVALPVLVEGAPISPEMTALKAKRTAHCTAAHTQL